MGATNLIPGPNSTEMTMHCGHEKGGWKGLFVAGACFILPAVVLTGILAHLYVTYGNLPEIAPFIKGIKPGVLAIILAAVIKLGKKAMKNTELFVLGALALLASFFLGYSEILVLLISGVLGGIYLYLKASNTQELQKFSLLFFISSTPLAVHIPSVKVLASFLKVGAILYGSGYVLFAYLESELVAPGLLTRSELIDAIAMGQFTPGPVLSTATFIGYQLNGITGAIAATIGIFLPSFLFVWLTNPWIPKMRDSRFLSGLLDSVNAAAVAIMLSVLLKMGNEVLVDIPSLVILGLALYITFFQKKISAVWVIIIAAVLGYLLPLIPLF